MDLQLSNKVALVSGGSRGIGEAIVHRLLGEGCRVVNVSIEPPATEPLASSGCYRYIQADLCYPVQCRDAVRQLQAEFHGLDLLVNNAGHNDSVGMEDGPEAFMGSLRKNLVHYYSMVHYSLDALQKSQGAVINIGSKVSITGQGGTSGYAAAKGGINSLTREWAAELAKDGVRVNAVIPAEVMTPQYQCWLSGMDDPEAEQSKIEQSIPLQQRFTRMNEVADMVLFLGSCRASHITGQLLFVDGGYTHLDRRITSS